MSPAPRRVAAALVGVLAVLLGAGAPAAAHGGPAVFEVLEAEEVSPGQVQLRLSVTYENDGDPAEGAIVEVVATGPGGAGTPVVAAERQAELGVYAATIALDPPGDWRLSVTSAFPPGQTEVPVTVTGAGTADDDERPAAAAPASTATEEAGGAPPTTLAEPEGGSTPVNLAVAAVSGVIGGALGLWVSRRRSRRKALAEQA